MKENKNNEQILENETVEETVEEIFAEEDAS